MLAGIHWTFTDAGDVNFSHFDLEVRRNFFLILKEAITNVVRHSEATHCDIKIHMDTSMLGMLITDNGKGFDLHLIRYQNGISNMRMRAERIKAKFELSSDVGRGTDIELTVPMQPLKSIRIW